MASNSAIEWTDATWNPITGCSKISPGCAHCYAERLAMRLQAMGRANYANGFAVATHEQSVELPLRWKKPRRIFVNSMSDIFHEEVPTEFILRAFDVMNRADWHQYQILTKRSDRLTSLDQILPWKPHIWMGVSVETDQYLNRIEHLRCTGAMTKFVSIEPLLGPMNQMDLHGIDWVVVGGESGPRARPMEEAWVEAILSQCKAQGVAFFFKQWGGRNKKQAGRILLGRTWDEMPPRKPLI